MGINGNFNILSLYSINEIPKVNVEALKPEQTLADEKPANAAGQNEKMGAPAREEIKNANIDDISMTFNLGENFGYIGRDRDTELLDMQKAVSEAKSDTVLRDYQYFVGNGKPVYESEDGSVFAIN